jgi:hypothetical protein
MTPVNMRALTTEQRTELRKKALAYLMFLKQKRCGKIKGRGCADGRKQRLYKTKEEVSSPTVRTESVMLSCVIDATEGRDVATADVPGAFMQTDIDEDVYIRMSGPLAKLLTKVDPEKYSSFVVQEGGTEVLYAKLNKALYGTLQAALLFWEEFSNMLIKDCGFTANPYDECVVNKTIEGHQCTVLWHVDDVKISHVSPAVVTDILDKINARFGKDAPLTITRGKIHEYLGMTIDFSQKGKAIFWMNDYVDNVIAETPDDWSGTAVSPAADHLNDVNPDAVKLGKTEADYFHTTTAKLLFLSQRVRPDIAPAVAFLTSRVTSPDMDDWKKLGRVIMYLRLCPHFPLTLQADKINVLEWSVDASYAPHSDMRSHTGGCVTLGKGYMSATSKKQKLNTRSSTEAELVAVDDMMHKVMWSRMFLQAQGYDMGPSVVKQDNKSAILLEVNGRRSSGARTRHLNVRYFFVTDRVKHGEVMIEYCPTRDMVADVLTKPLQGAAFLRLRQLLLNLPDELAGLPADEAHRSVLDPIVHDRKTSQMSR